MKLQKMKSEKPNDALTNISVGKVKMDDTDLMISELLQNKETLKSFINASLKDGVPISEIKRQLQYYGVNKLIT